MHELEPETEQVDSDDDDGDAADDPDFIGSTSQFLHIVNHWKAFMQWNSFPAEVLQQVQALDQAIVCQQVKTCKKQSSLMAFFN